MSHRKFFNRNLHLIGYYDKNYFKKRKNVYSKYVRTYKTRPTSFGMGSEFIILSKVVAVQADTVQIYNVNNVVNSLEWDKVKDDFGFFKIDRIALIFMPRVLPNSNNQDGLYVNINYNTAEIEAPSIQDNTQMIPSYLPKYKTLFYRVPHISVNSLVLNAWLNKQDFENAVGEITFTMSSPDNSIPWNFRIELGVKCRLPICKNSSLKFQKQLVGFKSNDEEDENNNEQDE